MSAKTDDRSNDAGPNLLFACPRCREIMEWGADMDGCRDWDCPVDDAFWRDRDNRPIDEQRAEDEAARQCIYAAAPMMLAALRQIMSHRHAQADWCPRCRKCAEDATAAIRAAEERKT